MIETDIKEFMRGNDLFRKLEVAIEEIRVGQADAVFEGLQNGKCVVDIVWDGAYVHIYPHKDVAPEPEKAEPNIIVPEEEVISEDKEPEQKKRRRYTT